jgi:hypothetical protein
VKTTNPDIFGCPGGRRAIGVSQPTTNRSTSWGWMARRFQEFIAVLEIDEHARALGRAAAQNGIKALIASGFHMPGNVENRLGLHWANWNTRQ